jgi:hypothetical protein
MMLTLVGHFGRVLTRRFSMKRVLYFCVAASAATIWLGCSASETTTAVVQPPAEQAAAPATDTAEVVMVTLSVPNMV